MRHPFPGMATSSRDMQRWRSDESTDEQSSNDIVEFKIFHSQPHKVTEYLNDSSTGYTWYAERLVPVIGAGFVHGKVYYGDAIDDEWYVAYLLLCTSERFKEAWIRVWDSDGEFLLVEAAKWLPRWLTPEVASNRVWLKEGRVLVLSKESACGVVSETEAKSYLGDKSKFVYSAAMNDNALKRARRYPKFLEEHYHYAVISIPRILADCLHEDPTLISALAMWSPCPTESEVRGDLVIISVRFTRLQYGQMLCEVDPSLSEIDTSNNKRVGVRVCSNFDAITDPSNSAQEISDRMFCDPKDRLVAALSIRSSKPLSSDEEIKTWENRADDESWLNVSDEKFESLLEDHGSRQMANPSGKEDDIMHSFEKFLGNEKAGWAGVEITSGSSDDEGAIDEESQTGSEVEDVDSDEFDEAFTEMLEDRNLLHDSREGEFTLQDYMNGAAEELHEAGILSSGDAMSNKSASNMMESLRTQGALPGPAGNILRSLGLLDLNSIDNKAGSPPIEDVD